MTQEHIDRNQAEAEIARIERAAERIFEDSPLLAGVSQLIADTRREIADAVDHRDVRATILSVLGAKNSGKSWLCRSLIAHGESSASVHVGNESENATLKLTWIGSEAPKQMHEEFETRIKLPEDGLVDLGRPYVILDVPGHNDVSEGARSAARKYLALAPLRVFITSWDRKSEESSFLYLSESDGTRILPIIVDSEYPRQGREYQRSLDAHTRLIKRHCTRAEICPPVVIPSIDTAKAPIKAQQLATKIVHDALNDFMGGGIQEPNCAIAARMAIFKLHLNSVLGGFFERVEPYYIRLQKEEDAAVVKIIKQLLGNENTLRSGVRMRLLMETVRPVPVIFFPYRILLTGMALAAGAVDRLILAFSGNLPSLAITAFQTARNLKNLQEMRSNARKALRERAGEMVKEELAEANDIFIRAIEQEIDLGENSKIRAAARETQLTGLSQVESRSTEIFEQSLTRHAAGRWLPWLLGGIATLTFFGLGAAPAWAIYSEFLKSWHNTFDHTNPTIWQNFPAPSGSMIFATLLLMTAPVLFIALITVVLAATTRRVKRCVSAIITAHENMQNDLLHSRVLRVTTKDPVREAVRTLLDSCRTERDSPDSSHEIDDGLAENQNP
ncbi:MAG: hypothetical protein ACSHX9_00080 [Luteolibacter sp.]